MPPDSALTAASTLIRNARVVTPHPPETAELDHAGAPLGRGGAAMRSILNALMDVRFGETVVQLAPAGTLQPRSDETTIDAPLPKCRDTDDQKFMEVAARCRADLLVTRDKELLRLARSRARPAPFGIVVPEKTIVAIAAMTNHSPETQEIST